MSDNRKEKRERRRDNERINEGIVALMAGISRDNLAVQTFYTAKTNAIKAKIEYAKWKRKLFWKQLFGMVDSGNLNEFLQQQADKK